MPSRPLISAPALTSPLTSPIRPNSIAVRQRTDKPTVSGDGVALGHRWLAKPLTPRGHPAMSLRLIRLMLATLLAHLGLAAMALVAMLLAIPLTVAAQAVAAQAPIDASTGVTVVVEVQLDTSTEPAAAMVALNDMRAMMKRQPGYLSETFLQNLNPANAPRYIHVSRWASMAYWSALFRAPEFARLNTHGNEHYRITASAFVPVEQ